MPTYEYECQSCRHRWELFQKMTARPSKSCPKCKRQKARRILSAGGGFLFKGSGFYTTDYRPESYKKAAKADHPPKADSGTTTADAKPASTAKKETPTKKPTTKNKS